MHHFLLSLLPSQVASSSFPHFLQLRIIAFEMGHPDLQNRTGHSRHSPPPRDASGGLRITAAFLLITGAILPRAELELLGSCEAKPTFATKFSVVVPTSLFQASHSPVMSTLNLWMRAHCRLLHTKLPLPHCWSLSLSGKILSELFTPRSASHCFE